MSPNEGSVAWVQKISRPRRTGTRIVKNKTPQVETKNLLVRSVSVCRHFFNQLSLSQKIFTGFAIPVVLMVVVSTAVFQSIEGLLETASVVRETQEVILKGRKLEKLFLDMETGERGFLITGKDSFLEPFVDAKKNWAQEMGDLKNKLKGRPQQLERLEAIDQYARLWNETAAGPEIAQRRKVQSKQKSLDYMQNVLRGKAGKKILNRLSAQAEGINEKLSLAGMQQGVNMLLSITKDIVDQETGELGFLITGEEAFLGPYYEGHENFLRHMGVLRGLVSNSYDKAEVLRQVRRIEQLAEEWLTVAAAPEIAIRKKMGEAIETETNNDASAEKIFYRMQDLLSQERGKDILDELRRVLTDLNAVFTRAENEAAQILILSIYNLPLNNLQLASKREHAGHRDLKVDLEVVTPIVFD